MNCIHHPDRDAAGTCASCGGGVCEFCRTVVDGIIYCPPCVDKMLASPSKAAKTPPQGPAGAPMPKSAASDPYAAMFAKPPAAPVKAGQATPPMVGQTAPYAARPAGAPALAGEVAEGGSKISALWMFIVSACGALVLGGVFMPWMRFTEWPFTFSISGWQATSLDTLVASTYIEPYLLIAGAAIMIACALPATVLALTSAGSHDTVRTLARFSSFGAGMVLGVIVWTIIDMFGDDVGSYISYGVWLILVASVVGLAASAFMSRWGGGQSRFYLRND